MDARQWWLVGLVQVVVGGSMGVAKASDPTPPCKPHQYCVGTTCRTVEPEQPGGQVQKQ